MTKRLLLIAPRISDIYKDIINQLNKWSIDVDYIEDKVSNYDPKYLRSNRNLIFRNRIGRKIYSSIQKNKWRQLLQQEPYNKKYDYLLVINGQSVHPFLIEELRNRNDKLYASNFLFDTCVSLYEFQYNFPYFDRVASFDRHESAQFNLSFLPIYWQEESGGAEFEYDLFCFGGYGPQRLAFYQQIEEIAKHENLKAFIKLYSPVISHYRIYKIKHLIRKLLRIRTYMPPEHYELGIITHRRIPANEFRKMVCSSSIIVDDVKQEQDGMTARFMWALGAGRKIVTTNANILGYDCYSPEQVYVVKEEKVLINDKDFRAFIRKDFKMTPEMCNKIMPWRLDNWLSFLLNLNDNTTKESNEVE